MLVAELIAFLYATVEVKRIIKKYNKTVPQMLSRIGNLKLIYVLYRQSKLKEENLITAMFPIPVWFSYGFLYNVFFPQQVIKIKELPKKIKIKIIVSHQVYFFRPM